MAEQLGVVDPGVVKGGDVTERGGWRRVSRGLLLAAMGLAILVKLWLTASQSVHALPAAEYDDMLFVRLAHHILNGEWLGPYDKLTLIKAPGYPLWVAATAWLGVPLLLAQQLLYAAACVAAAVALRPVMRSRVWLLATFCLLLFNPCSAAMLRMVREGTYPALVLLFFAMLIGVYTRRQARPPVLAAWACGAGLAAAAVWITREEGLWIVPSAALVLASTGWRIWREKQQRILRWTLCAASLAAWAAGVGTICAINYRTYGFFGVAEMNRPEFSDALGAMLRVDHPPVHPYIWVPKETRERMYAESSAFAELRPHLEGKLGQMWSQFGAGLAGIPVGNGEIAGNWYMWAVRDAAAAAGHHGDAPGAMRYYAQMAAEINGAVDAGRLAGRRRYRGVVPPWRGEYAAPMWTRMKEAARLVLSFDGISAADERSHMDKESKALYLDVTSGSSLGGVTERSPIQKRLADIRVRTWERIRKFYGWFAPRAAVAAAAGLVLATLLSLLRRRVIEEVALGWTVLAAILVRLGILGYIEVTSFPGIIVQYLSCVYPLVLLWMVLSLHGCWRSAWPVRRGSRRSGIRGLLHAELFTGYAKPQAAGGDSAPGVAGGAGGVTAGAAGGGTSTGGAEATGTAGGAAGG